MKSGTHFHFKQFSIAHDKCTHKVGTDGVLLGAWVTTDNVHTALEIGTGSGVIAVMLAQRTPPETNIDAVEIEMDDARQAAENIKNSPWPGKVNVHHCAAQEFFPGKRYDLIISNPPFFINSHLPPIEKRSQARHTRSLSFEELLAITTRLLNVSGRLAVILPFQEGLQFISLASQHELACLRKCAFKTREHKPVERWLLEFSYDHQPCEQQEILLYQQKHEWSEQYKHLTRDFYLKL